MGLYNDPSFVPSMSVQKMIDAGLLANPSPTRSASRNGDTPDGERHPPGRAETPAAAATLEAPPSR